MRKNDLLATKLDAEHDLDLAQSIMALGEDLRRCTKNMRATDGNNSVCTNSLGLQVQSVVTSAFSPQE
jgi:hypothetical protein